MPIFKNPNEAAYLGGKKHFTDVIKNSGHANAIIWRQPEEDFNTNSTLVVMPGEQAIFIKGGVIEQIFEMVLISFLRKTIRLSDVSAICFRAVFRLLTV